MHQHIAYITLLVREYDEAIAYYCDVLGFTLHEDSDFGDGKRWVLVAPPGARETCLLLAKATTAAQQLRVGDQAGGRVFLFLHSDNFWHDYQRMLERGVTFLETPREEAYGTVVVFADPYGNKWDLLQLR
jgi:catechol 2,3-dioxygenase-like lactoylglutathione lyase family enzyme